MMQHSGANNLVETGSQLCNPLNRKLAKLKIFQIVFLLQLFGVMDTRRTEVDTRDLRRRPAHRMLGGLGGSTSCNQDGIVFAVRFVGPEKMKVSSPAVRIVPQTRVVFQAFHGPRIRIPLVEILNFLHATGSRCRLSFPGECHRRKRIQKKREVDGDPPFPSVADDATLRPRVRASWLRLLSRPPLPALCMQLALAPTTPSQCRG